MLKLCEEYDEVTLALLRQHVSGAYVYFSRNDFAWLHEHVMYERDCAVQRQQDQETLKKVQSAYEQIMKGGNPEKHITCGYIEKIAGIDGNTLKYGTLKRPQTKALIDSVIESKTEWLHRRISAICEKKNGAPLSLAEYTKELLLHVFDFFHDKNPVNNINLIDNAKKSSKPIMPAI